MDNTATVAFRKYQAENVKNRHIDLQYKFVKELYGQIIFLIKHVPTSHNLSDLLSKPLQKIPLYKFQASYLKKLSPLKVNQELHKDTDILLPLENSITS